MAKFMLAGAALLGGLIVLGAASADPDLCAAQPQAIQSESMLTLKTAATHLEEDDGEEEEGGSDLGRIRKESTKCPELCRLDKYAGVRCTKLAELCGACEECSGAAPGAAAPGAPAELTP
mmetsp:Transcript_116002/g.323078  ORF Transcript_116002/g.323078 Transcript_116002/m.323078 type:complete len:120 (+) Transcript_116002:94-453(+)|eukprot:CAMPEP_0179074526 /NCGR_PEP_ID=MMETSP0796-20121207/33131_1 /TAXON_ID=73915 /ORGANISM="Pyrodinium bahamense, Strain pbaha01" /LENGTH=119 /DNA_ID=CAMNT_0020771751 /DNA_START=90 /DNA_END=449 /DNA_ORIENTATION=+